MLVAATYIVRRAPDLSVMEDPAVMTSLPDRVGEWTGEDLSYCQNESCLTTSPTADLAGRNVCSVCGGEMVKTWSLSERQLLPADTVLIRKLYRHPSRPSLAVSIVISSSEEVSIHRPQMCLTGQGYDISGEQIREISLMGGRTLPVCVLNLFHRRQLAGGALVESPVFYAYWFVSRAHETPSSAWRIFHATWDRVFHGRVSRWAYVSITGEGAPGSAASGPMLQSFVRDLYPLIMVKEKK
jgi:hypothetical protein